MSRDIGNPYYHLKKDSQEIVISRQDLFFLAIAIYIVGKAGNNPHFSHFPHPDTDFQAVTGLPLQRNPHWNPHWNPHVGRHFVPKV